MAVELVHEGASVAVPDVDLTVCRAWHKESVNEKKI